MAVVRGSRATTGLAAMVMAGAVALAGCAESQGSSSSGGGDGVAAGATKEQYQAAFQGVSPIKLRTQTPAPKGAATGLPLEKYYQAVTDWSGGKITWDIAYSNAVAPPAEIDNALVDGRLDFASVLPIYEPSEYPANTALIEGGVISDQSAVNGVLSSNAWPNEVAFGTEEVMREFDDHGLVAVMPVFNSGANALFCSQQRSSLASLKGASIGAGGTAQSAEVTGLGGSPSSIPYTELFESLQRGVVDCTVASPTVAVLGGFAAEAPHVVIDPDAGFALAPGGLAFSKSTWDGLPLVARQLLWDRMDVFIASNIVDKIFPNNAKMAKTVKENGGGVRAFDADARAALQTANNQLLDKLRGGGAVSDGGAFVDAMQKASDAWDARVAELGYDNVAYAEFDTWFTDKNVDLSKYASQVMQTVFGARRPS